MKTRNKIPCGSGCPIYDDYMADETALQEAEELAHLNWIEINRLYSRIKQLEKILSSNEITIPWEDDAEVEEKYD